MVRGDMHTWLGRAAVAVGLATVTACGTNAFGIVTVPAGSTSGSTVTQVVITPDTLTFTAINQTQQLTATALDSAGNPVTGASFTWASSNLTVVGVSTTGIVTSNSAGQTTVTASSGNVTGTAVVIVTSSGAVSPAG